MGGSSSKDSGIKSKYVKDVLKKFDPNELEVLHKIYKELSSRSITSGIDKETFLQYFNLPGLWGEQLFRKFDINYSGAVELEEFLIGIAISCRGTRSEKIYVLFKLFDLNNDNLIQKFELLAMLSNFPQLTKYLYTSIDNADSRFNTRNRNFKILDRFYEHKNFMFNSVSFLYDNERGILNQEKHTKKFFSPRRISSNESVISRQSSFTDNSILNRKDNFSGLFSTDKLSRSLSDFSHDSRSLSLYLYRNYEDSKNEPYSKVYSQSFDCKKKPSVLLKRSNSYSKDFNSKLLFSLRNNNKFGSNLTYSDVSHNTDHNDELGNPLSLSDSSHGSWSDIDLTDIKSLSPHDDPSSVLVKSIIQEHMDHEDYEKSNIDIEILVDQILEECEFNESGALCYKKFKAWLEKNDSILTMFSECLHEEVWGLQGNAFQPEKSNNESFLDNKYDFNYKSTNVEQKLATDKYTKTTYDLDDITIRTIYHVFLVKGKHPFAYTLENNLNSLVSEELIDHIKNFSTEVPKNMFADGQTGLGQSHSSIENADKVLYEIFSCPNCKTPFLMCPVCYNKHNALSLHIERNNIYIKCSECCSSNDNEIGVFKSCWICCWSFNEIFKLSAISNKTKLPLSSRNSSLMQHQFLQGHPHSAGPLMQPATSLLKQTTSTGQPNVSGLVQGPSSLSQDSQTAVNGSSVKPASTATVHPAGFLSHQSSQHCSDPSLLQHASSVCQGSSLSQPQSSIGQPVSSLGHPSCSLVEPGGSIGHGSSIGHGTSIGQHTSSISSADHSAVDQKSDYLDPHDSSDYKLKIKLNGSGQADDLFNKSSFSSLQEQTSKVNKNINFNVTTKSGLMYKIGKTLHQWKSRYYVLIGNILYYYKDKASTRPKGCIFLEGCYLDTLRKRQIGNKYGFSICHKGNKYSKRDFYVESMQDFLDWIEVLTHAMKQQTLSTMYEICEQLGQGKFSIVYRAICKMTGEEYAVKIIDKTKITHQERELLRSEISILKLLKHNNVIFLKDIIDMKDSLYIIMELVRGGELYDLIHSEHRLSEEHTHRIISQLLQTVAYLHKCGIIHRDLKPENLLLTDKSESASIKLTDFGLSTLCGPNDILTQPCGTLAYVAPEVLTMQGYNQKSDVWSIGVIMYLLIRGRLPFAIKKTHPIHIWDHYKVSFDGSIWRSISSSAKDLIKKLLEIDPLRRISVFEALDHIWVKNFVAVNHDSPSILHYNNLGESDEFYQSLRNTTDTTFVLPYSESCNRNLNKLQDVEFHNISIIQEKENESETNNKKHDTKVSKLPTVQE